MTQASAMQIFSYPRIAHALKQRDSAHDVFWAEACARISERVSETQRQFDQVLCLAPYDGTLKAALNTTGKCGTIHTLSWYGACEGDMAAAPEHIPFAPSSIDAAICALSLSTINDVPGVFAQLQQALKPDGMLLVSVLGGSTLAELRDVLAEAEAALTGGVSPRVHPFVDVREAGALLQRTGFNLPVIDRDVISVHYPNMFALMDDLRTLGASNMLQQQRSNFTPKTIFLDAATRYAERYSNAEGDITATLEIITLMGWKPHASQPVALKPGSAKASLADALRS